MRHGGMVDPFEEGDDGRCCAAGDGGVLDAIVVDGGVEGVVELGDEGGDEHGGEERWGVLEEEGLEVAVSFEGEGEEGFAEKLDGCGEGIEGGVVGGFVEEAEVVQEAAEGFRVDHTAVGLEGFKGGVDAFFNGCGEGFLKFGW